MEQIKVSIIMACYNEKLEWIKKSINSIINQTYNNIEIIIVNDNPNNERIIKLLKSYEISDNRVKVILNNENIGLVKSLNIALKNTTGDYIARMDADDISHFTRIKTQVEFLNKNEEVDIVSTYINMIDEYENITGVCKDNITKSEDIKKVLKYKNNFVHPTWMFKKNILQILNGYNEIPYAEDYEFLCRAVTNGFNLATIPEILLDYRVRVNSISNSNRLKQQIMFQIISNEYKEAIRRNKAINIDADYIDLNLKSKNLILIQNKLNNSNKLIYEKKYIKGYLLKLFYILINSHKRKQLINEIKFKINKFIITKNGQIIK